MAKDISNYTSDTLISGSSGNDTIFNNGDSVTIEGGKGNDSIYNSSGYYVSITGGADNDTIYGETGDDYLDGKDIIYGFDNTDMLLITGAFSASYSKSKKEIYFKVGSTSNAITLKDFGSTTSFNVNGISYKVSGSKLVEK